MRFDPRATWHLRYRTTKSQHRMHHPHYKNDLERRILSEWWTIYPGMVSGVFEQSGKVGLFYVVRIQTEFSGQVTLEMLDPFPTIDAAIAAAEVLA